MLDWVTALALPAAAVVTAVHPRQRADWRERWGLAVPPVNPGATWLVASSVGEVRAASALLPWLSGPVMITGDTDTGAALARRLSAVAGRRPIDHPWTLAPAWAEARPAAIVWIEGAYWPMLDRMARKAGVPTARVSGRPGVGTERWLRLGGSPDLVVAQDARAAAWFSSRCTSRVVVGGDLKWEAPLPANPLRWSSAYGVAGSTRAGDEVALLDAIATAGGPRQWLVAPRHPDRFDAVAALLDARGSPWVLRSSLHEGRVPTEVAIVLLDTLGELAGCYRGATVAFVGGGFDPSIRGHSVLEAVRSGVPVVVGPHHHDTEGATPVHARDVSDLARALQVALQRGPSEPIAQDAARCTAEAVRALARRTPAPPTSPRPWARPLATSWRLGSWVWHRGWDRGWRRAVRLDLPVVSVGSANARSPGRTSTVGWLVSELERRGHRVGVAIRGYRRSRQGLVLSTEDSTAAGLGDEGALLARTGVLVAACRDRVQGARALQQAGATVVVLDDGLQHRRLHRDVDLVVVDGRFIDARGPIPAGEAREDGVPARAHGVIVHHAPLTALDRPLAARSIPVVEAHRRLGPWVLGAQARGVPDEPVAAFAGIGRPADFLASLSLEVGAFRALEDHQQIDEALARELVRWAGDRPLVCTAKDHVRLPPWLQARTWWRTIELEVPDAPETWFPRC